ncbi:hypothetical protein AXF42_Ash010801 [Apostasia shenzhenica]|uniref:Uncharacterized protein n=1 Tax=Apostasia shenzhenica TaxID=1088818 RepID=A0A2I0A0Q0_9ASPA|nr:hypothetical protein AXF42_Ash010801 [Apostasia shenzhenica]
MRWALYHLEKLGIPMGEELGRGNIGRRLNQDKRTSKEKSHTALRRRWCSHTMTA